MAVLLAVGVLAGGCGGDDDGDAPRAPAETPREAPASAASWSVADVKNLFWRAVGIKLDERRVDGVSTLGLSTAPGPPFNFRYGVFSIHVTDGGRQLERLTRTKPASDGLYWRQVASKKDKSWFVSKRYDNVVVEWVAGKQRRTNKEWDRLVAVLDNLGKKAGEYTGTPPEELQCERAGITTAAPGKEGTCALGGQQLTIVNRDSQLRLPNLRIDRVRVRVADQVPSAQIGDGPLRARGRFVLVRYRIEVTGQELVNTNVLALVIGDRRTTADLNATADANPEQILEPGEKAARVAVFDVSRSVASRATRVGALEIANDTAADFDYADILGRIRLSPP
jgi:hypothetical protein